MHTLYSCQKPKYNPPLPAFYHLRKPFVSILSSLIMSLLSLFLSPFFYSSELLSSITKFVFSLFGGGKALGCASS
jgi:hypothetical protein